MWYSYISNFFISPSIVQRPSLEWDLGGRCAHNNDELQVCNVGCEDQTVQPQTGGYVGTALKRVDLADAFATSNHMCLTYLDGTNYINFGQFRETCIGNPALCTEGFTIAFWVKYTHSENDGDRYMMSSTQAALDGRGMHIKTLDGSTMYVAVIGSYEYTVSYTSIPNNEWFYLTMVYDHNTGVYLYYDGVLKASDTSAATPASTAMDDNGYFVLGAPSHRLGIEAERMIGSFSDLKIFYRALRGLDVKVLYDGKFEI